MFFIMGISNGEKKLDFAQTIICKCCGQYGRYEAYMTYTFLSLFFIPVFKWGKHYFVRTSCCSTVFEIQKEIGQRIAAGEQVELKESDLILVRGQRIYRHCPKCGFMTGEEFEYCPKCGEKLE